MLTHSRGILLGGYACCLPPYISPTILKILIFKYLKIGWQQCIAMIHGVQLDMMTVMMMDGLMVIFRYFVPTVTVNMWITSKYMEAV